MLVSVTVPTWNREDRLAALHQRFAQQTWGGELELVILDDSDAPSPYFREVRDERVTYVHAPTRATIGAKRDRLLALARGEIHLHFDDDDLYAPDYVTRTLAHLGEHDFFTYSAWHLYRESDRSVWRWDTRKLADRHYVVEGPALPPRQLALYDHLQSAERRAAWLHRNQWGYGFKYAYRRDAARAVGFADLRHGSDYELVRGLIERGASLRTAPDDDGVAIHVMQPTSTSRCFPQARVPEHLARRLVALPSDALDPASA